MNPSADDLDLELERFERKIEAGARFAMTQALFDLSYLDVFLDRLRRARRRSRCSSASGRCAATGWPLRLHNEVPGIVVPTVQERFGGGRAGAPGSVSSWHATLLEGSRESAAGIYVIPPFKQPVAALDLLE